MRSPSYRWIPMGSTEITRDGIGAVVYLNKTQNGRPTAIGYRGKSNKPAFNYSFKTEESRTVFIDLFFQGVKDHQERMEKRKTERRDFVPTLKPGDILDTCWGYDQTNREFFQVLSVTGKTALIREIAQKETESTGFMSGMVIGLKDQFLEKAPVLRRRVAPGNVITVDQVRTAFPWDGRPVCYTSYA